MTSQTYFGVQICSAWPSAALRPGAKRPDYERWEAWLPSGERVAGWSLPEIKGLIKSALCVKRLHHLFDLVVTQHGAELQKLYREIKFKCIPGLAEGSGTPISTEKLMNRYGFKDSTY